MSASIHELVLETAAIGRRVEEELGIWLDLSQFRDGVVLLEAYSPSASAFAAAELIQGTQHAFALACSLADLGMAEEVADWLRTDRPGEGLQPWELQIEDVRVESFRTWLRAVGENARTEFVEKPLTAAAAVAVVLGLALGTGGFLTHDSGGTEPVRNSCSVTYDAENVEESRDLVRSLVRLPDGCTITITLHGSQGGVVRGRVGPPPGP